MPAAQRAKRHGQSSKITAARSDTKLPRDAQAVSQVYRYCNRYEIGRRVRDEITYALEEAFRVEGMSEPTHWQRLRIADVIVKRLECKNWILLVDPWPPPRKGVIVDVNL